MTTVDQSAPAARGADAYSPAYRTYILVLLTSVYVTNYADRSILTTLTEPIKHEFGLSDQLMGMMGGVAFAIFYTTAGLPMALLADRMNRTRIMAVAAATWSLFTTLCGFVTNAWQLFFARIGVGIGEAGGSPPAHAIVSDLFEPRKRATALSIYALGVPIGFAVGSFIGAPVAEHWGWRTAFLVLGIPGLVLSALVWLTVREPRRGLSDPPEVARARAAATAEAPALGTVLRFMLSQKALVHMIAGATIVTIVGYAGVNWNAAFLMRSHGFTLSQAGFYLGMVAIFASTAGTFIGGILADQLGKRDRRWNTWIVALFYAICLPVSILAFSTDDTALVVWLLPIPTFVAGVYLGPTFAMTQNLVGLRMRALASAILLFIINLVGMSIGPWLAGFLSDMFREEYGQHALRHALFLLAFLNIWGIAHYALAGRDLVAGYDRAARN
ncbi:MAG: MFS transporter [Alphaproteobacteria bacterium]|nr:MFS transporter [Alphaproteobacteria bacterium]